MTETMGGHGAADTTGQDSVGQVPAGEVFTRTAVTVIMAVIAMVAFAFSFGNIWALGLHLGVSPWISPLVGPAVDLSVVGLLVAIRYLSVRGVEPQRLRLARFLLVFTGAITLTLNTAEPVTQGAFGRAAFDAVGPVLLIGWAEVGPGLLRLIHGVRTAPSLAEPDRLASERPLESARSSARGDRGSASGSANGRSSRRLRPQRQERDLLAEAQRIDADHRRRFRRPVSAETLRQQLRISSARARQLVRDVRSDPRQNTEGPAVTLTGG
jgi:hypothetical protein